MVKINSVMNLYNELYKYFSFTAPDPSEPVGTPADDGSSADGNPDLPECDGSVTVNHKGKYVHCLTVIGQIEGHYALPQNTKATKYEHIIPRLVAVEENPDVSGLLLILNTVGGDIEAGLAIAELISSMSKPTVSLVLGGSHSIGIPLAVSTDHSFIVPTASMTVHPVRMNGLILGVPQSLLYLQKMEERVLDFVTRNSKISADRFKALMLNNNQLVTDFGTVLDGREAVEEGLIDEIGGLNKALDFLAEFSSCDS